MIDIGIKPNQPDPKHIKPQVLLNIVLRFQSKWYQLYPFLHYCPSLKAVLYFDCVRAYVIKTSNLAKNADPAFSTRGYKNWKNANLILKNISKVKLTIHVNAQEATPVDAQLSRAWAQKQMLGTVLKRFQMHCITLQGRVLLFEAMWQGRGICPSF